MTDEMEERLRDVLGQRAEVPNAAGDPVASVRARMQRRTRRRGIVAASTTALCVAAIAITASALAGTGTTSHPVGPVGISSVHPTTPAPASPAPSSPASAPPPSSGAASALDTSGTPTPLPPNVSSLTLPTGYTFGSLAPDSGHLLLIGVALPTTATSGTPPNCATARISDSPFALSTPTTVITLVAPDVTTTCRDRAWVGEQVAMVITETSNAASSSGLRATIAILRHDPATDKSTIGPVVMTYTPASDTAPVAAYGGGSLWIYDVETNNGPEAVQVSATSGQVEDVVRTPLLYRPIMAANSDGLWLGNSIEGSQVAGTVFHVTPGSHTVTTVVSSQNDAVDWLVADSGHVWAGIRPSGSTLLSLWRFDGPQGIVALHVAEPTLEVGPNYVVGDEQDGLWLTTPDPPIGATPSPQDNQHLDVVRLDANTGKRTVEAALPPLDQLAAESQTASGQAAFFAGNYFLLQSPSVGGNTGFTQVLRVTPLP
jgi:hypothetical protein